MRAINHALTGAIIGFVVSEPVAAVPLALGSHYLCDVLPHYGPKNAKTWIKSTDFSLLLGLDALLCVLLVTVLAYQAPFGWQLASICAFVAVLPDFASVNRYIKVKSGQKWKPGPYIRFANGIQWFERPIGIVVEVIWLVAMLSVLITVLG